MRSHGEGILSATTQVKVLSPEIILIALDQGFISWKPISGYALKVSVSLTCRGLSPWRANELTILELGRTESFRMEAAEELKKLRGRMAFR